MRDFTWRILNPVDYVFTALIENYVINVKANEIWIGNGQYNWQPIEDAIAFAKDCKSRGIDVRFAAYSMRCVCACLDKASWLL